MGLLYCFNYLCINNWQKCRADKKKSFSLQNETRNHWSVGKHKWLPKFFQIYIYCFFFKKSSARNLLEMPSHKQMVIIKSDDDKMNFERNLNVKIRFIHPSKLILEQGWQLSLRIPEQWIKTSNTFGLYYFDIISD